MELVSTDASTLFAHLDDHARLSRHMERPSLMMAGATMRVETDAALGREIGSKITVVGQVLGLQLRVEEVVTERVPPLKKTWETQGEPDLLVIGAYRMSFTITPEGQRSRLVVLIDYELPPRGVGHWLGVGFARSYAAWCTQRMVADAVAAFDAQHWSVPSSRPTMVLR